MRKVRWPEEIQFEVPVKGWQHNHTTNDLPDCSIWPETHLFTYPNVECAAGYLGALWCFAELTWPLVYLFIYFFIFMPPRSRELLPCGGVLSVHRAQWRWILAIVHRP